MKNTKRLPFYGYIGIGLLNAMLVSVLMTGIGIAFQWRALAFGINLESNFLSAILLYFINLVLYSSIGFLIVSLPQCISMGYLFCRRVSRQKWRWILGEAWFITTLVFAVLLYRIEEYDALVAIKMSALSGFLFGVLPCCVIVWLENKLAKSTSTLWVVIGTDESGASIKRLHPIFAGMVIMAFTSILVMFFSAMALGSGYDFHMALVLTTIVMCLIGIPQTLGVLYIVIRQTQGKNAVRIGGEALVIIVLTMIVETILSSQALLLSTGIALCFMAGGLSWWSVYLLERLINRLNPLNSEIDNGLSSSHESNTHDDSHLNS